MSDLLNRAAYERVVAGTLARLGQQQANRLTDLLRMGRQPDDFYWAQNARENAAALFMTLSPVFQSTANGIGGSALDNQRAAFDWAHQKADALSAKIDADSRATWAKIKAASDNQMARKAYLLFLLMGEDDEIARSRAGYDGKRLSSSAVATAVQKLSPAARINPGILHSSVSGGTFVGPDLEPLFGPRKALGTARTSITSAHSAGQLYGWSRRGGVETAQVQAIWRTDPSASKSGPCPVCDELDGTDRDDWGIDFPDGPPAHENCILPWNLVVPMGKISAGAKSFYRGPVVEVALAGGRKLSCTINHPVLTRSGWVLAGDLREGMNVLCAPSAERVASAIHPNNDYRPAAIEQVFRSLEKRRSMVSARMKATAEQFHGDGRFLDGDVHVVHPDGFLRSAVKAKHDKGFEEFGFGGRSRYRALSCGGSLYAFGDTSLSSTAGGMSTVQHLMPSGVVTGCPADCHSLGPVARRDSGFNEQPPEGVPVYASSRSHGLFSLAGEISLNKRLNVTSPSQLAPLRRTAVDRIIESQGNVGAGGTLSQDVEIDPRLSEQFVQRFSSEVSPKQVIKVRRFDYSGHVYDLQCSKYQLYACNGVIVHNCVCWLDSAEE